MQVLKLTKGFCQFFSWIKFLIGSFLLNCKSKRAEMILFGFVHSPINCKSGVKLLWKFTFLFLCFNFVILIVAVVKQIYSSSEPIEVINC